ncbi:AAA-like domain protein [compost metagenome]
MTTLGNENLCADSETAKRRAYFIKSRLDELGHKLPLTHAYEVLAASCGYRNWPTMKAQFEFVASKAPGGTRKLPDTVAYSFGGEGEHAPALLRNDALIDILYAPPGYGKSSTMNALNYELVRKTFEETGTIPEMAIIDVGCSAKGLVSYLQDVLPPRFRDKIAYHKFANTKAFVVNPFDTHLGFRVPTDQQKRTLAAFLLMMARDKNDDRFDDGHVAAAHRIIDALYSRISDKAVNSTPKIYSKLDDLGLSRELAAHDVSAVDGETTWWAIVDALADRKLYKHARLAQRHAMPTMTDLSAMMWGEQFSGSLQLDPKVGDLVHAIRSMADTLRGVMPLFSGASRFDKGNARIVVADIEGICPPGSRYTAKMTELAYHTVAQSMFQDFFLTLDDLAGVSDRFKVYHTSRMSADNSVRQICMDDIHRAADSRLASEQHLRDVVTAKSLGVRMRLSSQITKAFHPGILSEASNIIVLGASPLAHEEMESLGLTPLSASRATRLSGPEGHRKEMLVRSQTGTSAVENKETLETSPAAAWVIASAAIDVSFRTMLADRIGMSKALELLAEAFPAGSAAQRIERVAVDIARNDPNKRTIDVLDDVMEELIAEMIALAD